MIQTFAQGWQLERFNAAGVACSRSDDQTCEWNGIVLPFQFDKCDPDRMVKVTTEEGEQIHYHQEELSVGTQLDGETDTALLLWPLIISHKY